MGLLSHGFGGGAEAADPVVEQSLRFEDGDTPSLERTVTSAGSSRKFTLSLWAKRGKLGALTPLFSAAASGYEDILLFNSDDTLVLHARSGNDLTAQTLAKFRDTSAFYHIVVSIDTEQSTASDRLKIFVNGTLQSYTSSPSSPAALGDDYDYTAFNAAVTHYLGFYATSSYYYDGTFADVYFLDGTAKVASDFAEENSNGQWVPKATSFSGSDYGDNGFHIDFVGGHDSELLLQSNHKQGSTNFEDSSGAGHYAISTSGDPQHSIKVGSPFTGDDRSIYFDGDGDYLSIGAGSTTDWDFGTGDFTIECWVNFSGSMSNEYSLMGLGFTSVYDRFYLRLGASFDAKLYFYVDDAGAALTSSSTYEADRWYHVAVVREGDDWTLYVDGVAEDTETNTGSWTAIDDDGPLRIGDSLGTQYQMSGFMYDIRVIKGTAAYTGNFTPPSGNLTKTGGTYPSTTNVNTSITASHTKLLIQPHQTNDSDWTDNSDSDHTITGAGDLSTYADPTASTPYAGVGERSAIQFDGSDYLSVPDSADFSFGDGDFTIEAWVNFSSSQVPLWFSYDSGSSYLIAEVVSGGMLFQSVDGGGDNVYYSGYGSVTSGEWSHWAVVRDGASLKFYQDGVEQTNGTATDALATGEAMGDWGSHYVGRDTAANANGYIYDLRITKGEAKDPTASGYLDAPFESTAVIHPGGDSSGKRNHFDVVNIAYGDVVRDCPESGANFATLNSLVGSSTFSEGNLKSTLPAGNGAVMSNIALPSSGKWYCECWFDSAPGYPIIGVGRMGMKGWASSQESDAQCSVYWNNASFDGTGSDFTRAGSDGGSNISFSTEKPIGVLWDADNDKISVTDGTNTLTNTHSAIPSYPIGFLFGCSDSSSDGTVRVNFGADASFAGAETGTPNTGGGGEWALTLPTGYKALKTDNLSTTSATTFSYVGNESTDGPFIYMGYRPSSVTIGGTTYDDDDYNPSEDGSGNPLIDWLANGIKIRTDGLTINGSGTSYSITAAPKEQDFKYGTAR